MPLGKKEHVNGADGNLAPHLDRITRLLALLTVKGEDQPQKVLTLAAAGFSASEIAQMLNLRPNNVSVLLYRNRPGRSKARARRTR